MKSRIEWMRWSRLRVAAMVAGVVTMSLAIWGHHFALGEPGRLGAINWLGLLAGLGILVASVLGPKAADAYRTTAVIVLNTMLAIVAVELLAAVVYSAVWPSRRDAGLQEGGALDAAASSYYDTLPWGEAYWQEFQLAFRNRYRPFYLWRLKPFAGRLIRVDSAGLRETPGARCTAGAYRVFAFGGSTMWGMGSPDAGSIPAHLQEILSERLRRPVCVRNFGQLGFTSAQDLVQLESELRAANVPDLALFYGGSNDIAVAFGWGQTGVHFDLLSIAAAFEGMNQPPEDADLFDLVRRSNLYRLAAVLVRSQPVVGLTERRQRYFESDSLADAVVVTFANHHRQAEILGRGYGFRVAFFWQPTVAAGAKPLTEEERRSLARDRVSTFATRVHDRARVRLTGAAGLHSLADVFANDTGLVYVDSHHLTPEANRTIAQAIVDRIEHELRD